MVNSKNLMESGGDHLLPDRIGSWRGLFPFFYEVSGLESTGLLFGLLYLVWNVNRVLLLLMWNTTRKLG